MIRTLSCRRLLLCSFLTGVASVTFAAGPAAAEDHHRKIESPTLTVQQSGTVNRIQAISPVNERVVWASGVGGTYLKTTNGGKTWHAAVVPGAEALQFRDVEGVSEEVAYLLSAGSGTDSRVYKTEDGGAHWKLQFQNQDPNAFYDCFAFWTPTRGLATSDSVNGRFPAILTRDGETWTDIGDRLPKAQPGEASFAASGTCVATEGKRRAWIGTGGAPKARILRTTDGGDTWAAYETPIVQGTAASGVFSVDFRDAEHGILGAGDLFNPTAFADTVARSHDGGESWQLGGRTTFPGAIYGLSYVRYHRLRGSDEGEEDRAHNFDGEEDGGGWFKRFVVATGPNGAAWSPDEGATWRSLPGVTGYWAVAFATPRAGWLVGVNGAIVKISFEKPESDE